LSFIVILYITYVHLSRYKYVHMQKNEEGFKMNVKSINEKLGMKGKVIVVLAILAIVVGGYYAVTVRSDSRITKALSEMPVGQIQMINDAGETITLDIRIAETSDARNAGFRGVGADVVNDTAILYRYTRDTVATHLLDKVRVPLDLGFFNTDGELITIAQTEQGASTRYSAGSRVQYRYILMSGQGFFERHGVSADGGASLVIDSLSR